VGEWNAQFTNSKGRRKVKEASEEQKMKKALRMTMDLDVWFN
jgi:hypothetical protein